MIKTRINAHTYRYKKHQCQETQMPKNSNAAKYNDTNADVYQYERKQRQKLFIPRHTNPKKHPAKNNNAKSILAKSYKCTNAEKY